MLCSLMATLRISWISSIVKISLAVGGGLQGEMFGFLSSNPHMPACLLCGLVRSYFPFYKS